MKVRKNLGRLLLSLSAMAFCIYLFPTAIFAQESGADLTRQVVIPESNQTVNPVKTTLTDNPAEEPEAAVPLTPDGNLTLVDDIKGQESGDKQFITVMTKAGKTFYIVIDRVGDKQNVYFLNLVDEADLMALIDDKKSITGNIVKEKEVSSTQIQSKLVPTESVQASQPTKEPNSSVEKSKTKRDGTNYIPVAATVILLMIGGVFWFTKLRESKINAKRSAGFDEYTFDDDGSETIDSQMTNDAVENTDGQEDDGE